MRKSNIVVALICIVAAIVLTVLYVVLGFEQYEHAKDFILAGIWMLLLVALVGVVTWREGIRKRLIRRFYISETTLFNAEYGPAGRAWALPNDAATEFAGFAANVLSQLRYGFDVADRPTGFDPQYVVDSDTFKARPDAEGVAGVQRWSGTVSRCERNAKGRIDLQSVGSFSTAVELQQVLKAAGIFR